MHEYMFIKMHEYMYIKMDEYMYIKCMDYNVYTCANEPATWQLNKCILVFGFCTNNKFFCDYVMIEMCGTGSPTNDSGFWLLYCPSHTN